MDLDVPTGNHLLCLATSLLPLEAVEAPMTGEEEGLTTEISSTKVPDFFQGVS